MPDVNASSFPVRLAFQAGPKTPCGTSGDKRLTCCLAGPEPDVHYVFPRCMCVKPVTSDGSIGYGLSGSKALVQRL